MKTVQRDEIVDYVTYEEHRERSAPPHAGQDARRVHVGPYLTSCSRTTRRSGTVQEMMRAERMVKEADIRHEIETYNELLGGPGEVGCTLLIELDDPRERAEKLTRWLASEAPLRETEDGQKAYARFDERQVGDAGCRRCST